MAKHFDRVLATKGFTTLPKHLQEELLLEIEGGFVSWSFKHYVFRLIGS